ncbi:MAG: DUF1501 domain-containing protein [Candidatus Kapabacteria bacterium]|jgi:uncharacterized protein (DUF1501 family)|nr:DUF1501 domain-containing protein [Candidatus Kapabacteria bacterium]
MKRRDFIRGATAVALPLSLSGYTARAMGLSPMMETLAELTALEDRYLVLIQLAGGNDGINTVVPLDQMSDYNRLRSNVALPENRLLKLNDKTALHPSMVGMKSLYDSGRLAVMQGVAYPGSNFSHFRSTDIWMSSADFNETLDTGWMGRYLDTQFPNYPVGYPSTAMPDPLAIQISATPSLTLKGTNAPMGINIQDPVAFQGLVTRARPAQNSFTEAPDNAAGQQIAYIRQVQAQSDVYAGTITKAYNSSRNLSTYTPANVNPLADQLAIVARLIAGGLKTRVYLVTLGGFDTHAQQVVATDRTLGSHATLLARLSEGITSFQEDLRLNKIDHKVIGMTFSEFGRRVQSNVSSGTDHGTSAPVFLFGSSVRGGVLGTNPSLTNLDNGNLRMQYDFRQIYATILKQWFGTNNSEYTAVLGKDFTTLPLIQGATSVANDQPNVPASGVRIQNFPNPVSSNTTFEYTLPFASRVRLSVVDAQGRTITTLEEQQPAGTYNINFDAGALANGAYQYRLETERGWASGRMIVAR